MKKLWIASTLVIIAMTCGVVMGWNVKLTWDANPTADEVTEYGVYKSTASGTGYNKIATVPASPAPEYEDQNLVTGMGPFFYVVTATNATDESPFSSEVRADEPLLAPGAPVGLTVEVTISP